MLNGTQVELKEKSHRAGVRTNTTPTDFICVP